MESKLYNMNDNKLIAEFMEHEILYRPYSKGFIQLSETEVCDVDDLKYHTSWDWLMPVVEKIESLRDPKDNAYRFTIDMCNAQIEETNIEMLGGVNKLDTTYDAVVQFINQYNKTI